MTGKWVGAFVLMAFVAFALYFANSSLSSQSQPVATQVSTQTAATNAAADGINTSSTLAVITNIADGSDKECGPATKEADYRKGQPAKYCADATPEPSSLCGAATNQGNKTAAYIPPQSQAAAASLADACKTPLRQNLCLKDCTFKQTVGSSNFTVKGICNAVDKCHALSYTDQNGKTVELSGNAQTAGNGLPPVGNPPPPAAAVTTDTLSAKSGASNTQLNNTPGANTTAGASLQAPAAAPGSAASAQAGITQYAGSQSGTGAVQSGATFQQNPSLSQSTGLNPTGSLAVATPPPVSPTAPVPTAPTTFSGSGFTYTKSTGGVLQSPVTSFTSKISSGAFFSGVTGFLSGLFSSLGSNSSQTTIEVSGGSYTAPGAGAPPTTVSSNPGASPTTLILVMPAANGTNTAGLLAQENFQKLLNLGTPGIPQGTQGSVSLSSSPSSPSGLSVPAAIGGSADILSAYSIGTGYSFAGEGTQGTQGSDISNLPSFLDLSWATPTAVTIGVPVSLNAAPPASTVFDEFNAGWAVSPQTLLQVESALAQAQIDYESTQAQLSAWQQLQDVGLCATDCLTSMASLESQGWQQQAQVDALTRLVENGGTPSPQASAPPAGFPVSGQGAPYAPGNPPVQNGSVPAPVYGGTSPVPAAIAQYASQPETGTGGFGNSATQTAPAEATSSGGLLGLPAILATIWQTISNWLQPGVISAASASSTAPVAVPVQTCSLFSSLFGGCTGS